MIDQHLGTASGIADESLWIVWIRRVICIRCKDGLNRVDGWWKRNRQRRRSGENASIDKWRTFPAWPWKASVGLRRRFRLGAARIDRLQHMSRYVDAQVQSARFLLTYLNSRLFDCVGSGLMYSAGHWKTRHRYAAVCGGKKMRNKKVDLISVSFFKKILKWTRFRTVMTSLICAFRSGLVKGRRLSTVSHLKERKYDKQLVQTMVTRRPVCNQSLFIDWLPAE